MSNLSGISGTIRLRGFVSQIVSPIDEWASSCVIVQTEPESWMATMPLEAVLREMLTPEFRHDLAVLASCSD